MTDHLDPTSAPDPDDRPESDDRIDALARAAGRELRRPAPTDGLHRAQRSKQRRDVARVGGATAALALVVAGAVTFAARDDSADRVPVTENSTSISDPPSGPSTTAAGAATSTTVTSSSSTTSTTTASTSPTSTTATSTTTSTATSTTAAPVVVPTNAAGDPTTIYTFMGDIATSGTTETLIDPSDGSVIETRPVDFAVSQAAQDALLGRTALQGEQSIETSAPDDFGYAVTSYTVGSVTYRVESLLSDLPSNDMLAPETLARFDACAQGALTVEGADRGTLPERVSDIVISADGRWIATTAVDCPVDGTLAVGGRDSSEPPTITLFDTTALSQPGLVLFEGTDGPVLTEVWFSPDGAFVSVSTDTQRFYDLPADSLQPVDLDGCNPFATKWSRFIGPWIGESSIALVLKCSDGLELFVRDLATGEELRVDLPEGASTVDVDYAHYDRPTNVWFTACDAVGNCWYGQGGGTLRELPDANQASFLPLGFTYGG